MISQAAADRLMRDLERCCDSTVSTREGFDVETIGSNLFEWSVRLHSFDNEALLEGLLLFADATAQDAVITLRILFPATYPAAPPFIRVISPRFHAYTAHVVNGAICVIDLTMSGWSPKNDIVQIIVMVRDLFVAGGALVSLDNLEPYSEEEALASFMRVAKQHGWIAVASDVQQEDGGDEVEEKEDDDEEEEDQEDDQEEWN